jgi:hypothetical protein
MVSNGNKPRASRAVLCVAAIASVVVPICAATPAKAHDDDEDRGRGYYQGRERDHHEDREQVQEAWERHERAEQRPYGYGYYARPRAYYYSQPRVYYPPPAYYSPQPFYPDEFSINIPVR